MVKQGSIVMIDFNPVVGSEQGGRRPGVIISSDLAISKTNILFICPITTKQGKRAMNVLLDKRTKTQGVVLCAHCKSIDINKRSFSVIEQIPQDILYDVISTVTAIITG
ncbi:MAG: type II toxin-antitoxin system PemK/MazF family toxin [Oscillospiraceae bacterium]|nr:type II toxin-antitoxin system PemK/MazF family toxin [Oscillospiraceae bacterium]